MDTIHFPEMQEGLERGKKKLEELALAEKVKAKLRSILGLGLQQIEIMAEKGVVFLKGTVLSNKKLSADLKEECKRAVMSIDGAELVEIRVLWLHSKGGAELYSDTIRIAGRE